MLGRSGLAMILAGSAAPLLAQSGAPATRSAAGMFGAREAVLDMSLSPDGNSIAVIQPTTGQGSAAYTIKIGSSEAPKRVLVATGNPERLEWCRWASDTRLVCLVYFVQKADAGIASTSRIIAVDSDGGNIKLLSKREGENALGHAFYGGGVIDWLPDENGAILMQRYHVPESKIGSLIEKTDDGLGVDRVDVSTLATKPIERPRRGYGNYITDGHGNVRIVSTEKETATGYANKTVRFLYRKPNSKEWEFLSDYDSTADTGFYPVAVDPKENTVYGFDRRNGLQTVAKRWLDGSNASALVYAHPRVDVDGVVRIGKSRRIVGVSFATDKRQNVYFDPVIKGMTASLGKALGGKQAYVTDASNDEQKLLLFAGSDTDPGKYYLFDRKTKQLGELLPVRSALAGTKLAEVRPVEIKAADGTMVPGYLTLPPGSSGKNLPALVMPHGGPSARDEWGFDWLSQYFANQGFAVLQPNFRGSAGYGDNWLQVNGFQSWKVAIGDVADSGRWLVSQGIADPQKLGIFGWSYGGYAALQSGVIAPDLFKAIIAVAPVTDFDLLRRQYRNSYSKFLVRDFIGSGPHITEGSPAQNAKSITAPVLMFHGTLDLNVDYSHATAMEGKLNGAGKKVELVTYEKLDHYLEDSAVRAAMLEKSVSFLKASMGDF